MMRELFYIRGWSGRILNIAGFPGFVRPCQYNATITDAYVAVRLSPRFTIVSVNGLDVYFHRVTGTIDGIGFSQTADCKLVSTPQSIDLGVPPSALPPAVQTGIQSEHVE
jgi:hypothetical protein